MILLQGENWNTLFFAQGYSKGCCLADKRPRGIWSLSVLQNCLVCEIYLSGRSVMVVYPVFAWKHNEGPPFCTRNMICLSRCSKSSASHLSPYPSSLAQSQRKDQFLPLLMITKPGCMSCLFFKQALLCVLPMLPLRLQSNPPEMSTKLSPYFLMLGFAAVSTEPRGTLRLLRCFGFECWTSCVVFLFSSSFIA